MATSSSPLLPSPSKKLLITDPKPKPISGSRTTPLNSASSSSATTMPQAEKRTRDQPNLSDCHCCGRRINHINPKDRLQPLDSIWRIVLLCRKCRKKLNSGQTCPYCFQETVNSDDLFKCTVCQRKIHKDCARDYRNCTPWCYLGVGWRFRVCMDCWIPDSLKNSIRVCGRSENKGICKDKGDSKDFLEKTVKDAKCDMEKKVTMAAKAKEQALRKASVAKNAVNYANQALDLLAKKDRNDQKGGISDCSDEIEVADDAELAFQLHRAMNSSPRILRGKNAISMDNERINSTDKTRPLTYKRDRKRKVWHIINESSMISESRTSQLEELMFKLHLTDARTCCPIRWGGDNLETHYCVNADKNCSCINIDRFGQEPVVYKRTRFRWKVCQENGMVECSSCDNQGVAFKFQNCQPDDIKHELPLVDARTDCLVKGDTEVILPNGSCSAEHNRYFLKYGKRVTGSKSGPTRMFSDCLDKDDTEVIFPNGSCYAECDRYFLKYGKRVTGTKSGPTRMFFDCLVKGDTEIIVPNGSCNAEHDRYFLKYNKRVTGTKCDGKFTLPNGSSDEEPDRYCFKYVKRVKGSHSGSSLVTNLHSDAIQYKNPASAPGLTMNCSAESRTVSDISFESFTIDVSK